MWIVTLTETQTFLSDSTVPNQAAGVFWAVLNRLLIIFQTIVLILSELGWPSAFFNRFFPVLGKDFGLGALGVIQCLYVCLLNLTTTQTVKLTLLLSSQHRRSHSFSLC